MELMNLSEESLNEELERCMKMITKGTGDPGSSYLAQQTYIAAYSGELQRRRIIELQTVTTNLSSTARVQGILSLVFSILAIVISGFAAYYAYDDHLTDREWEQKQLVKIENTNLLIEELISVEKEASDKFLSFTKELKDQNSKQQ